MYVRRLPSPLVPALLAGMLVLAPQSLPACGWWGDSVGASDDAVVVGPEGEIVEPTEPDSPEEMARLSRAYRVGDSVPKDSMLARLWARRAAEAGHAGAMNDLGQMLEAGIGGSENQADAVFWYRKANPSDEAFRALEARAWAWQLRVPDAQTGDSL